MHVVQKTLLLRRAAPAILHADDVAIGKIEFGDIERIAESMLGNMRVRISVHPAAGIGGDLLDLGHRLAEPAHCRGLNRGGDPLIERGHKRAGEGGWRAHFDRTGRGCYRWSARRTERRQWLSAPTIGAKTW